jgi:thiosulfate dehydrogenase [quinone] large subunit
MAVTHGPTSSIPAASHGGDTATGVTPADLLPSVTRRVLAVLRIAFGLTFLWAFLDKTFALGFSTGVSPDGASTDRFGPAAWILGGNPTQGFLAFGAKGPFEGFYHSIAGATWVNWLFMLGLLGIGLALTFGVAMRFAAAAGAVMCLMMWTVALPPDTNPLIDDHILGALTVVALALLGAGNTWGLGRWWSRIDVVKSHPVLR